MPVLQPAWLPAQQAGRAADARTIGAIDAILAADKLAPPKQRHTAKRIFQRLKAEHGCGGGYTTVKSYVHEQKLSARETFVPLAHPPGHAQVDFGEANDTMNGGAGDDTIEGGAGHDLFVTGAKGGRDHITDFGVTGVSGDKIDIHLSGLHVTNLQDLLTHTSEVGGNAVIDLGGGNSLTLDHVDMHALTVNDFVM